MVIFPIYSNSSNRQLQKFSFGITPRLDIKNASFNVIYPTSAMRFATVDNSVDDLQGWIYSAMQIFSFQK